MPYKHRESTVENKYNLTIPAIRKLKVKDRSLVCEPLFSRNNVVQAWCIVGRAWGPSDNRYHMDNEFWIGVYDEDAREHAGEFQFSISAYGGMALYDFQKFFQAEDIECENDMVIQEKFLDTINRLIDMGILGR